MKRYASEKKSAMRNNITYALFLVPVYCLSHDGSICARSFSARVASFDRGIIRVILEDNPISNVHARVSGGPRKFLVTIVVESVSQEKPSEIRIYENQMKMSNISRIHARMLELFEAARGTYLDRITVEVKM